MFAFGCFFRMEYYLSIRDIQTLGMLACVLTHNAVPDSFKPQPSHITGSKSFTYGITSPACGSPTHQVNVFDKSYNCCGNIICVLCYLSVPYTDFCADSFGLFDLQSNIYTFWYMHCLTDLLGAVEQHFERGEGGRIKEVTDPRAKMVCPRCNTSGVLFWKIQ